MAMTEPATKGRARKQRTSPESDTVLTDLSGMVDELIRENTRLKRELKRLEQGRNSGNGASGLAGLHRRLANALGSAAPSAPKVAVRRPRGKITDPVLLQKKREALAKAREAQAVKRAAANASPE